MVVGVDVDNHAWQGRRPLIICDVASTILNVPDISCEHCERTITEALSPVEGVRNVGVDIPRRQVRVEYDDAIVSVQRFREILAEEEYPVESVA
jgi:copper chaperone